MENNLFKTVLIPNWDNVPVGTKFKAKIQGVECEGRIQKEDGCIYLCQNKADGGICDDELGFDYSWSIKDGSLEALLNEEVEIISLELDPSFVVSPALITGEYRVIFEKGKIHLGFHTISNEQVIEIVKRLIW